MIPKAKKRYEKIKQKEQLLLRKLPETRKQCKKYSKGDRFRVKLSEGVVVFIVTKVDKEGVWGELKKGIIES